MNLDTHDFDDYGVCRLCGATEDVATECPAAHRGEESNDADRDCPVCFVMGAVYQTEGGAWYCTSCRKYRTKQMVTAELEEYVPLVFE